MALFPGFPFADIIFSNLMWIFISSQFARVVKGVDLRSTAGNCAWARTPQLTGPPSLHSADMHDSPHPAPPVPPDRQCIAHLTKDPRRVCRRWARVWGHGGEVPHRWYGSSCSRRQRLPLPRRTRVGHGGQGLAAGPQVPSA